MTTPIFTVLPLSDFDAVLGTTSTEVSSVALGGQVLYVSDDFFAPFVPALSLILSSPLPAY